MSQIMDRELAIKRAGGRPELAAELHAMLIGSLPDLHASIGDSWQARDLQGLYTHVHKLNGSTRYCGVPELEDRCERLETQIHQASPELEAAVESLLEAIRRLQQTVAEF